MLREFSDLACGVKQIIHAPPPSNTEASPYPPIEAGETDEHFREMMHRRYTMPLVSAIPYQHWGINE